MAEPNNNVAQQNLEGTNLEPELASSEPEFNKPAVEIKSEIPEPVSAPSQVSNLSEKSAEFANNVKETTTQAVDKLQTFQKSSSGQIITMTIVGILVVAAIALILYYIIQSTMISQTSYILKGTTTPVSCTTITNYDGSGIPNASAGVRSGMCFWIYIYDISKYQGSLRHVFHRGTKTDGFGGTDLPMGPYVALDPNSSSMSILFGPGTTSKEPGNYFKYNIQGGPGVQNSYSDKTLTGAAAATKSRTLSAMVPTPYQKWQVASQSRGIVFPYIPLQRWVHVACVINENINGGTITGYIDGELAVTVNSTTKTKPVQVNKDAAGTSTTNVTPVMDVSNINMKNTGDVYVGGSMSDPIGPGFSGLVSKIQFYNYDISAQDVYANYQSGPINNILAKLGLPAYGLQSPIYKIG